MAAPTATHNATIKEYCIYVYVCEKLLLVVVVLLFSLEYFSILPARLDFSSMVYILERNIRIVLNKGLYSKTWKQLFF